MISLKFFYRNILVLLFSFLCFSLVFYFFIPIFKADSLIFPYCISPFDIINIYPQIWKIIKIIYCINLFLTIFLILNSIFLFLSKTKKKSIKKTKSITYPVSNLDLFVGFNSNTNEKVFIPQNGLFQNILITGTIGSRKN